MITYNDDKIRGHFFGNLFIQGNMRTALPPVIFSHFCVRVDDACSIILD